MTRPVVLAASVCSHPRRHMSKHSAWIKLLHVSQARADACDLRLATCDPLASLDVAITCSCMADQRVQWIDSRSSSLACGACHEHAANQTMSTPGRRCTLLLLADTIGVESAGPFFARQGHVQICTLPPSGRGTILAGPTCISGTMHAISTRWGFSRVALALEYQ